MSMSRLVLFSIRARGRSPLSAGAGLSVGAGLSDGAEWPAQPSARDSNRSDPVKERRIGSLASGRTPTECGRILARARRCWLGLPLAALAAGPVSAQTVVPSPAPARTDSARGTPDSTRGVVDTARRATGDTVRPAAYDSVRRDSIGRPVGDSTRAPAPANSQ